MKPEAYHIVHLIGKFLQQTISDDEMAVLQTWLDESAENRALLESFRKTVDRQRDIDFLSMVDADAAWDRFRVRKKRKPLLVKLMKFTGYAAAVVLVVFFAWRWVTPIGSADDRVVPDVTNRYHNDVLPGEHRAQLLLSDGTQVDLEKPIDQLNERDGTLILGQEGEIQYDPPMQSADTLIYNTLVVPKAGTYRIVLSDGTKVWVNALSELYFPVHFGEGERRVSIKGEAYFEVAHDADRPFRVEVNGTEVEVLGTQFNVNAYTGIVRTALIEGAVSVRTGGQQYQLSPGQQSYFDGQRMVVQQADLEKVTAWKEGEFRFKSDNISEIMEQLARWYDLNVTYGGDIPINTGYSGKISRDVNLTEVLEMLRYVSKAKFEVDGRNVNVEFK